MDGVRVALPRKSVPPLSPSRHRHRLGLALDGALPSDLEGLRGSCDPGGTEGDRGVLCGVQQCLVREGPVDLGPVGGTRAPGWLSGWRDGWAVLPGVW